jgi:hypothetical protein
MSYVGAVFDLFCYLFGDLRWSFFSVSSLCLYFGVSSISVLFSVYLLCLSLYLSPLKYSVCAWNRRHLSRLHVRCSGFPTIWLLWNSYRLNLYLVFGKSLRRKLQIRTRPLSSNVHIWSTAKSVTIFNKSDLSCRKRTSCPLQGRKGKVFPLLN